MNAVPCLPPGFALVALISTESTNEEAKRCAESPNAAPDGLVVWALEQRAGKGRRGRGWVSPPGNLYSSILLRPGRPLREITGLGFAAALAIRDSLLEWGGRDVLLKWPNDVLLGERKIAGVLLESRADGSEKIPEWVVVGAGVNLASHPGGTEFPATSLAAERHSPPAPAQALETYVAAFARWRARWLDGGLSAVLEPYRRHLRGVGAPVSVRIEGETVRGIFDALEDDGTLALRLPDGPIRRISAGDVFFARGDRELR
jgi:BirA family biotin operon repressor/biotin-[acetyl-CoA-carboxylase] ligase